MVRVSTVGARLQPRPFQRLLILSQPFRRCGRSGEKAPVNESFPRRSGVAEAMP